MNIFFDMEFTGLHQHTTPISIGLISDDEQTFYAEFTDYDESQINDWLWENVMPHLFCESYMKSEQNVNGIFWGPKLYVVARLREWLSKFGAIEMWSDCLAYDWVLFCELFGGGVGCLPENIYYIPFDICTLFKIKDIDPDVDRIAYSGLTVSKHNALDDARTIKACYEKVMGNISVVPV